MTEAIIVSGVLGSGKTTVVNRLIPGIRGKNLTTGAMVNDIGQLNVDAARIELDKRDITDYTSGCVCCERREDLLRTLGSMDIGRYDVLLIEPTGAANPLEIADTVTEYGLRLSHLVATVPVKHFNAVKTRRSLNAGLEAASVVCTSWMNGDPTKEEQVKFYLEQKGVRAPRIPIDRISYDAISEMPFWSPEVLLGSRVSHDHGHHSHEHYNRSAKPLDPSLTMEETEKLLRELAGEGIERAKGIIPQYKKQFDIVNGDLVISDYRGSGVMPFGVFISQGRIDSPAIRALTGNRSNESLDFAVEGSTHDDYLGVFNYYYGRASSCNTSVGGVVSSNFEGPDEAYTAAKELLLKYGDENPLRLALVPYVDIRLKAMQELAHSSQPDRAYAGVMLGSFMMQMLGEHDGIRFDSLTDPSHLDSIKKAAPDFYSHLADFDETAYEKVGSYDNYGRYFHRMAVQGAPFVEPELRKKAYANMAVVYDTHGKKDIASLWRDLWVNEARASI